MRTALPAIHVITTDEIVARSDFTTRARAIMEALGQGVALHVRASRASGAWLYAVSNELARAQEETGAWLVVNDRVDVALAAGARGVQLTSRSIVPVDARRVAPSIAIGASVHALGEAFEAERGGADWLVAGHVFDTGSHPGDAGRGRAFVSEIVEHSTLPVVAIGGIRPAHLPFLRSLGVHGVAAIRGIWGDGVARTADPAAAAREYLDAYGGAA